MILLGGEKLMKNFRKIISISFLSLIIVILPILISYGQTESDATVVIYSSVGGTTDPETGSYSYPNGTVITLTAIPDDGYEFQYWVVEGVIDPATPTGIENQLINNQTGQIILFPSLPQIGSLVFTTNPAQIICGFGYTYSYQAVFTPILAGIEQPTPIEVADPLQDYMTNPTQITQVTFVTVSSTPGGTTTPSSGRYAYGQDEPTFSLTATPDSGYEFKNWVVTGEYMPGHGGDPSLDTNVITDNPLQVSHGMGYTYNYEAVFTQIPSDGGNGGNGGDGTSEGHPFGLSNEALYVLIIILVIAVIAAIGFGFYAYRRK